MVSSKGWVLVYSLICKHKLAFYDIIQLQVCSQIIARHLPLIDSFRSLKAVHAPTPRENKHKTVYHCDVNLDVALQSMSPLWCLLVLPYPVCDRILSAFSFPLFKIVNISCVINVLAQYLSWYSKTLLCSVKAACQAGICISTFCYFSNLAVIIELPQILSSRGRILPSHLQSYY